MELIETGTKIEAEHGVVASFPNDFFGYFGWPTVTRMDDGTLVIAASGLRNAHVCPFGRSVLCSSADDGKRWTSPFVVNDYPLDDRDTGVLSLGGKRLLISWFSTDTRLSSIGREYRTRGDADWVGRYESGFTRMTDQNVERWYGSWIRLSPDGGETWGDPVKVDLSTPHGPVRLRNGKLLYLGKELPTDPKAHQEGRGGIAAMTSADAKKWKRLGTVPLYPGSSENNYYEPNVVELPDGRLLGLIRISNKPGSERYKDCGLVQFSLVQTESADGGNTWTRAEPLGFHGSPPHLLLHSSGALVCVYGYRLPPFGQRAMVSRDGGATWRYHYILRDDGPDHDLGYPSSVELPDGSLFTTYYQKIRSPEEKCSILWTRWNLPA